MVDISHIPTGVVYLFFGTMGGIYALRTLNTLRKSPELKTQVGIWLPILVGTMFFAAGGFVHIFEHTLFEGFEVELLNEALIVIGLSSIVIGVMRYSKLQIEYVHLKTKVLDEAKVETVSNQTQKDLP